MMNFNHLRSAILIYLPFAVLLLPVYGFGQAINLDKPTTGDYFSSQSITLLPGFSTSGPFRAYIIAGSELKLASLPSQDRNYILTNTVKQAGITDMSQLSDPTIGQVNQSIQYFDGLGKPLQIIQVKGSADGLKDIVQPFAYDVFGRQDKKYLQYNPSSGGNGAFKTDALEVNGGLATFYKVAQDGIAATPYPYSQAIFESSPLNRVVEQGAQGTTWQPVNGYNTGHTVKLSDQTNNSSVAYATTGFGVRLYLAEAVTTEGHTYERTLSSPGLYAASSLYLTITKDENWVEADGKLGTIEEYKDLEGHMVLKRTFNKVSSTVIETLSTYYVYDDQGNLSFILPPHTDPDGGTISQAILDQYAYQYRYDGRSRQIEKKVPGKGWEFIVYNKLNKIILTQDANQATSSISPYPYWSFIKYDVNGRVIMTGLKKNYSGGRQSIQDGFDSATDMKYFETRDVTGWHGYTNVAVPSEKDNMEPEVVNYYDDYDIPDLPNNLSSSNSNMTAGLLTAKKVKVLGTADKFLWTINYYNDRGELVKVYQQHYKGGVVSSGNYDLLSNTYSFTGQLLTSTRNHYVNGIEAMYVYKEYTYDHMGRMIDLKQKTGDNSSTTNPLVLLSRDSYNGLGQLTSKSLHSTDNGVNFAQKIKYNYNERGWLKGQSAPLFAMELKYDLDSAGSIPQYNGNISSQKWGLNAALTSRYTYTYDKQNRLITAISNSNNNERIGYDNMGNIIRMQRHSGGTLVDQMRYNYSSGNSLTSVVDSNSNTNASFQLPGTTSYLYDDNGNMKERLSSTSAANNMYEMSYNHLNQPTAINANGALILYTYDGEGNKLQKQVTGSVSMENEYVGGIQYEGGVLKSLTTEIGRVVRVSATNYSYEYTLTDHLGNGRVYFDVNAGVARKIQETDYYAFGLAIQKSLSGSENKYQYNGKEKQDQEQMYDYGARFYDPVIGRWSVVDPLSEKMESFSPYNYVLNNPLNLIDPTGTEPEDNNWNWDRVDPYGRAVYDENHMYIPPEQRMFGARGIDDREDQSNNNSGNVKVDNQESNQPKPTKKLKNESINRIWNWMKHHFEVSGGYELSYGAQLGGGFKEGASAFLNIASTVHSDLSFSNKSPISAHKYAPGDKITNGAGAAYYLGIDYKHESYGGQTTNTLAVGLVGFGGNISWNSNGVTNWFLGFDPSVKAAFVFGLEGNFRMGFSK